MSNQGLNIPINTKLKDAFNVVIHCLNPLLKLKPKEKEVLATIMYVQYSNRGRTPEYLEKTILSTSVRKLMRKKLNMGEVSFNNHIVSLRRKKALIGNTINPVISQVFKELESGKVELKYTINVQN